jgi:hypothetical protein
MLLRLFYLRNRSLSFQWPSKRNIIAAGGKGHGGPLVGVYALRERVCAGSVFPRLPELWWSTSRANSGGPL